MSEAMENTRLKRGFWATAKRGAFHRCPSCGEGRLFAKYLKQVEQCSDCGEALGHIRADDGPAWLTILLVGHLLAPIVTVYAMYMVLPEWLSITLMTIAAVMLTLIILPSAKGIFIAAIWRAKCEGSKKY